ncbi:MAG TPA: penicillin acylase family protein, partial [Anaerolineae bacterium]|nr:penicillin acylase family protein [Anaerolineae bacterium]
MNAGQQAEIIWDTWGVPHIDARDEAGVFRAFGWAQMRDHGDLVLRLYGRARGRAAEYWGAEELAYDRLTWTWAFPDTAAEWYAAQSPAMRANLDAF